MAINRKKRENLITDIEKFLPRMRRFGEGNRTEKKETIIKN